MIDLYTWNTPNGRKAIIMLEELAVPYTIKAIDISSGEQKRSAYVEINPNGRIPAIYDHETCQRVFESGAILIYLAEKYSRFFADIPSKKAEILSWLFWQAGGLGPIVGQFNHFSEVNESQSYSFERFKNESLRLLSVLNKQLERSEYLAGNTYTIADMMSYTWVDTLFKGPLNQGDKNLQAFKAADKWRNKLATRPAVVAAIDKISALNKSKY